jgi:hypothetical protein
MSPIGGAGVLSIFLGLILWYFGGRSRGEMDIEIGTFKGPVWFLLIVFGLFLIILDATLSVAK